VTYLHGVTDCVCCTVCCCTAFTFLYRSACCADACDCNFICPLPLLPIVAVRYRFFTFLLRYYVVLRHLLPVDYLTLVTPRSVRLCRTVRYAFDAVVQVVRVVPFLPAVTFCRSFVLRFPLHYWDQVTFIVLLPPRSVLRIAGWLCGYCYRLLRWLLRLILDPLVLILFWLYYPTPVLLLRCYHVWT